MKLCVFRNYTIEPLFSNFKSAVFSEYGSAYLPDVDVDVFVWCYFLAPVASAEETLAEIEDMRNKLQLVNSQLGSHRMIAFTLDGRYLPNWQLGDNSVATAIAAFNDELYSLSKAPGGIKVINTSRFFDGFAVDQLIDRKYYYLSKMILNPILAKPFQSWFDTQLKAINGQRKKCLVIDLDNTFWGGILGEDGLEGIKLGNDYPGNCFLDFQKQLKELQRGGTLLAICSKNNEDEVWDAFDNHPDIVLKKNDFVSARINWSDKAGNLQEIAEELNIGLDSLVFIDDNPAEREIVKQLVPEVTVPDFPEKIYLLPHFFQQVCSKYFLAYQLTNEDLAKTDQYKANFQRTQTSRSFASITEYLRSLNTVIKIDKANSFNVPRISQLTQKTNQFNLTTRRYTEDEIARRNTNSSLVFCASVSDRFGDSGITGVGIIDLHNGEASIDSYLLSCRILGREIESVLLKTVLNFLFEKGQRTISATYIPSSKNRQTENFYEKLGFIAEADAAGAKRYRLTMDNPFVIENLFTIDVKLN
jgi:FkbH-like protein